VTFSGAGVVGNSIANGEYQIVLNASDVSAVSGNGTMAANDNESFYRLYGDLRGTMSVTGADNTLFGRAFGATNLAANFVAALDYSDTGSISGADNTRFGRDFGLTYSGFTPTI
jgi:hypothetical protein